MGRRISVRAHSFIMIQLFGVLGGWLGGYLLDAVLFSLSFDYVYPPDCFQRKGLFLGWLGASFVWFLAAKSHSVAFRGKHRLISSYVFAAVVWGLVTFGGALGYAQLGFLLPNVESLGESWPRRFVYCRHLPVFAFIGWMIANVIWVYVLGRQACAEKQSLRDKVG